MKFATFLAIFACCLALLALADPTSTALRVSDHRQLEGKQQQLASSDASSETDAKAPNTSLDAKVSSNWRQEMLNSVNKLRSDNGLPPLAMSDTLNKVSQDHSDYQAQIMQMTHEDSRGPLGDRVSSAGLKWTRLAENVGARGQTVDIIMNAWEHSPSHMANILGDYTLVGFGLATDGAGTTGDTYWTQTFASTS
ncbi:hypothetical protein GGF42_000539 [Coemansia sp. RSA 2424]|nr:hypothetical protein GGF42_000539 [Coemansia sp. RSA 2424]